ncbi:hypothetical protein SmJEL517_g05324 [Synchytrium microbalum]|uniref:U3 small nucleolar RNA-associated protein 10 n=1 Tax=Synchytrium microbalum TaxID=1806994 RepID=A0A507BLT7_9FUNG|nr:uncharacterized protein SmJEL517_g05324 [Synchytrium microbalum]TPX31290.1 hypothetical protein SmJEL517_g05324 [Synchytrium microbalum]
MPAPTSNLKAQLQQLQDRSKVITRDAIAQPSYIGDPDIDRDTLHALALQALQELTLKDQRFQAYELTLFSDAVKNLDRTLLTRQENDLLDASISGLLQLLSKYFLEASAAPVLEWLVRRFSVHRYNVNQVLEAIVPYHATPQFVRMLVILNLHGENVWTFLKRAQKAKVAPDRTFFLQECHKHPALLQTFVETTLKSIENGIENVALWSFFAALLMEYLSSTSEVTDNTIRNISPLLFEFLKATRYPDVQTVACMSFALMLRRVPVIPTVTTSVLEAMASAIPSSVDFGILTAMVSICQTQSNVVLPIEAISRAAQSEGVMELLSQVCEKYQADAFVIPLTSVLIHERLQEPLTTLLHSGPASPDVLENIVTELSRVSLKDTKNATMVQAVLKAATVKHMSELMICMDKQQFKKVFVSVYRLAVNSTIPDGGMTIAAPDIVKLNHQDKHVRIEAIKNLDNVEYPATELTEVILPRLHVSENADVILAVFKLSCLDQMDQDKLADAIIKLANTTTDTPILKACLKRLIKSHAGYMPAMSVIAASLLVTRASRGVTISTLKLLSEGLWMTPDAAKTIHDALQKAHVEYKVAKDKTVLDDAVAFALRSIITNMASVVSDAILKELLVCKLPRARMLGMLVTLKKLYHVPGDDQSTWMSILLKHVSAPIVECGGCIEGLPALNVTQAVLALNPEHSEKVESLISSMIFTSMLSVLPRPLEEVSWLSPSDDDKVYCDLVYDLYRVASASSARPSALKSLFEIHVGQSNGSLPFLFRFILHDDMSTTSSPFVLATALAIVSSYIHSTTEIEALDHQVLLPGLFIALRHASVLVRSAAQACIKEVWTSYQSLDVNGPRERLIANAGSFYGSRSDQLQYIETRQASKLVERVMPYLPEWFKDRDALDTQFGDFLLDVADGVLETRDQLVMFFLTHVLALSDQAARCSVLRLLERIDTPIKLQTVFPLLSSAVESKSTELATAILKCYTPLSVSSLSSSRSKRHMTGYYKLLDNEDTQRSALEICTPIWYHALREPAVQHTLFTRLVDLAVVAPSQTASLVRSTLSALPIPVTDFKADLKTSVDALVSQYAQALKKSRVDESGGSNVNVAKLTILLELIPRWSDIAAQLLDVLFEALALTIDVEDTSLSTDYLRQLLLSGILLAVERTTRWGSVRIDLVVQSMRVTDNPQIHQTCLLILAALAKSSPEDIVHNIMSVFTFMTNNLLRVDDSYSFHVADQLVEAVVPSLMRHSSQEALSDIIQLFVDAIPHIPAHRRVPLFVVLLNTMGPSEYLRLVISLAMKSHQFSVSLSVPSEVLPAFCIEVSREFDVQVILKSSVVLLEDAESKTDSIQYVSTILADRSFTEKVPSAFDTASMSYAQVMELYSTVCSLLLIRTEQSAKQSLAVLSRVVPLSSYMEMASSLFSRVSGKTKLRVISSLREALVDRSEEELRTNADAVNVMIQALEKSVMTKEKITSSLQITMETFATAVTRLGKLFPDVYSTLLSNIVNTYLEKWTVNSDVLAAGYKLLAALCRELGPRTIPSLPKLIPQALTLAAEDAHTDSSSVHESVVLLIDTTIRTLPKFVAPSIPHMLDYLALKHSGAVYRALGKNIEATVLLKVVSSRTISTPMDGLVAIYVLNEITAHLSMEDLTLQNQAILQLYLRAFDVSDAASSQRMIDSIIRFIMRLNETLFKPLFLRIRYWALSNNTPLLRKSLFWKLVSNLLDKLQSIFGVYVVQILDEVKDAFESEKKTKEFDILWSDLWSVMRKFLIHYTDGALASHISPLISLMVDQIMYTQNEDYLVKMFENVVPTLGQMANSLKDQPLLRTLHQQVLAKTRHDNSKVRLVAVCCLTEMWTSAGESLHVHLPETAPFLAELVEDDDEQVEKATRQLLNQMQTLLGSDEKIEDLITED